MKKVIILSGLFYSLLWSSVNAQQMYFNNRYDYINSLETIFSVIENDTGYICVAGNGGILMIQLDDYGDTLWRKFYWQPGNTYFAGGPGSLITTNDGGYALGGGVDDSVGNDDVMLYKFNKNGDTLWTRRYGDSMQQSGKQCKQTPDDGYIVIGVTTTFDPDGDFWLIKTDSMGNVEWDQTYGGVEYEFGLSVDVCNDGGYILTGTTRSYGQDIGSTSDIYVIKVDSMGNEQWNGVFGGPYGDAVWNSSANF